MKKAFLMILFAVFFAVEALAGTPPAPPSGTRMSGNVVVTRGDKPIKPPRHTVATLPTLTTADAGAIVQVTDGDGVTDCTSGGGTDTVMCRWTGSAWANMGDGQAAGSAEVQDEVFSAANFNGDTSHGVSQDDFYDLWHGVDADDDGSFADETWLTAYLTEVEAAAAYQPRDDDLTAVAALTTDAYGLALLELTEQAELVALLPSYQAEDSDLTTAAGADSAGNSKYFGTDAGGTPGYYDLPAGGSDAYTVKVDAAAAAGYIGAAAGEGAIRTDGTIVTKTDGGDYVTIGVHAYLADIAGITANQGDIIYFDGTDWVDLPPGTTGQYLQTQGAGANPQWASTSVSGDIENVGDVASGAAFTPDGAGNTLYFEGATANAYEIALTGADPGADVTVTIPAVTGTIVLGPALGADNILAKTDGTGTLLQATGITVDDSNNVTGAASVAVTSYIALGADPADAGSVRLPNAGYVMAEADAAGTDISVIGVDASEVIQIGASGASGVTVTPAVTLTGGIASIGGASNLSGGTVTLGTIAGTVDLSGATVTYGLTTSDLPTTGSWDMSSMTVTFGLETTDIPDLSGTYEVQLNNEAGLYAVLSDVTMFLEDLVDDATPQLGGDLDVNSHEIQSSGDIVLQLGDAAGANDFVIQDSAGTPVFSVNSDGTISQIAVNNPYVLFDDNDMATEFAIRSTDSTTPDQLTIGTTTDAMASNFTTLGYFDVNKFDYDGNVNISTGHTYQINGTQINIGNLGAAGNWTPTGTLNLDGATLQNIGHGTVTAGDSYTTISNNAAHDTVDELFAAVNSWAAGVSAGTLVTLSDVGGSDVYTAGYILIGDGTDSYDPKAISGAITLASDGATTLNANSTIGTSLAIGADPADAGTIRLPNAGSLVWEDATEASITHVDNTGWLINAAHQLQFRDSAIYINSGADGYLDLEADTGIRFNGPVTFVNEGAITLPANSVDSDQYVDNSVDAVNIADWYAYDILPIGWAEDGTAAPDAIDDTTRDPLAYRTFAADSTEDVNFVWFVPSDLSGDTTAVQYRVKYLVTNATGPSNEGVAFTLAGVSLGDNDATNAAKGTAVTITDTAITADQHDILITGWSGDVTVTNIAAGEIAELAFTRDHDHASDDYGQVVGVLALEIRYVRNVSR